MDNPYKQFTHFAFASDSQKRRHYSFNWIYFWPVTFLGSVDFVATKEFMDCSWRESLGGVMGGKYLDEERRGSENRKTRINGSFQKCVGLCISLKCGQSFSPHPSPSFLRVWQPSIAHESMQGNLSHNAFINFDQNSFFALPGETFDSIPFYPIWSLSCIDQSFPENFKSVDKRLMFSRKSFRYGKQKINYFLLKNKKAAFKYYIQISEKTERKSAMTSSVCDMQLFICLSFFLKHASQYSRI